MSAAGVVRQPDPPPTSATTRPTDEQVAFDELLNMLVGVPLGEVLARLAALARTVVPGVDDASITLLVRGTTRSAAFTGDLAARLDERQYEHGFGPCLAAAASGGLVVVPDTRADAQHPGFAREAARAGIMSCWAMGFPMPHDSTGALGLYVRGVRGEPSPDAVALAGRLAAYGSVALANAALYADAVDRVAHLETAMASRAAIEQAKGMLMAARGCTADEAFQLLARSSQRHNRKLRDVALQVVQARGELA